MPRRWDDNARIRANQIDSGLDLTFSKVFVPFFKNALCQKQPKTVLEVGGGTGHLARELVQHGRRYVLIEPSAGMYSVACETLKGTDIELYNQAVQEFSKCDRQFDVVLSHLCMQVIPDITVFLNALACTLAPNGSYLLSFPHPAFYNDYKRFFPPDSFRYMEERAATVSFTVTLDPNTAIEGVPYHHRPISTYFAALSNAGLVVRSFDEIYPSAEIQKLYGAPWLNPRYLVIGGERAS